MHVESAADKVVGGTHGLQRVGRCTCHATTTAAKGVVTRHASAHKRLSQADHRACVGAIACLHRGHMMRWPCVRGACGECSRQSGGRDSPPAACWSLHAPCNGHSSDRCSHEARKSTQAAQRSRSPCMCGTIACIHRGHMMRWPCVRAVSYTHLTLPTILLV